MSGERLHNQAVKKKDLLTIKYCGRERKGHAYCTKYFQPVFPRYVLYKANTSGLLYMAVNRPSISQKSEPTWISRSVATAAAIDED